MSIHPLEQSGTPAHLSKKIKTFSEYFNATKQDTI